MTSSEAHITSPPNETSPNPAVPSAGEGNANPKSSKKKAIVVYEGDERWQPPSGSAFARNQSDDEPHDQEDEASDASESEGPAEHCDFLVDYASDTEV